MGIHQVRLIIVASLHNEEMKIISSRRCVRGAKVILLIDLFWGTWETHALTAELLRQVPSPLQQLVLGVF